jgi:two-component system, chemotaxis family, chemotaxis protein CheY
MRILIADDQRNFGTTLADMVRYCGHEVVGVVGSGLEAIHAYSLHKPDLVLMDYRMPKLNGATASRHIIAKDPGARIVLLSAWSPLDGADASGALCFLPKPVDMDRLSATLLTVAQTIPPSASEMSPSDFGQFQSDVISFDRALVAETPLFPPTQIPPEIISPIETFPIATFPIEEIPVSEIQASNGAQRGEGLVAAKQSKRKSRKASGRKRRGCAKKAA